MRSRWRGKPARSLSVWITFSRMARSAVRASPPSADGTTWEPHNTGVQAEFLPEGSQYPEFGQCVHKIARHPSRPDRMFMQNHGGVYRSDDGGTTWNSIEQGLPANFGFRSERALLCCVLDERPAVGSDDQEVGGLPFFLGREHTFGDVDDRDVVDLVLEP